MNVTFISGKSLSAASAAISAFGFPTWRLLNKNCRFRFEMSIVSKSTMEISPTLSRAKFLISSHPMPPAPMTSTYWGFLIRIQC
ncbi:hypothetical protein C9890_0404 [Perkinsus sp. BL_2016]|nr:hypothetical protein C9890_0404 [Perkinsus sp. BL_2016]